MLTTSRLPGTLVLLGLLATAGCREMPPSADQTLLDYAEAVQARDFDRLFCLSAGAAGNADLGADPTERRRNFEAWAQARYETYLLGRDEGHVALDDEAIPLVKAFSLGRGTFATYAPPRSPDDDSRLIRSDLRFGYDQVDLSRFSPGTTLYLCGLPPGRIHAVQIPRGYREVSVTVLASISVDWGLVQSPAADGCPAGWAVAAAHPVEETATTTELTWVF